MSGLKIVCPICTDEFIATDEIYSTSCGHLYHYRCVMQWQSRSTSCPQCREHNPSKHRVFLNIEDGNGSPSAPPIDDDLNIKLASSVDKIHELQAQLQESELNFFHLQEQYTIEQNARKDLESTVSQSNENESNFLRLHGQYSETEDRCKILQEENELLSVENEFKSKELALRATEISMLKESLAAAKQSSSSDTISNAKIGILEQKLRHIMAELEKQISESTRLAVEKIKMQSYIQQLTLQGNTPSAKQNYSAPQFGSSCIKEYKIPLNVPPVTTARPVMQEHKLDSSSVLLQHFPLNVTRDSLDETVIAIAAKMNIIITKDDIKNVKILNNGGRKPQNIITAYVQFKTDEIKLKFLKHRDILRKDDTFGKIIVKEFTDPKVHALFLYANRKLRGNVFGHIACMNNSVTVKKYRTDMTFITIQSTEQVDSLLKNHMLSKDGPSKYLEEDKIDDCYYKI